MPLRVTDWHLPQRPNCRLRRRRGGRPEAASSVVLGGAAAAAGALPPPSAVAVAKKVESSRVGGKPMLRSSQHPPKQLEIIQLT